MSALLPTVGAPRPALVRSLACASRTMLAGRRSFFFSSRFAPAAECADANATLDRYLAAAHDDPYAVRSPGGAPYVSDAYADDFAGYYRAIELEGARS